VTQPLRALYAFVDYPDPYVQPLILQALSFQFSKLPYELITSLAQLPSPSLPLLQFKSYEALDFGHALKHPKTSLISAYVIRKALIRKHYLSNTVSTWIVKHPQSLLQTHFKPAVHFELDFAEFLDEALIDAWDLNESLARNDRLQKDSTSKEWWILKPGMSDGGNGIRLFSSLEELREIFEEWEEEEEEEEEEGNDDDGKEDNDVDEAQTESFHDGCDESSTSEMRGGQRHGSQLKSGGMTSQLRHFIAQPYIHPPLLLESKGNKKFHIRVYVLAVGALKVYVFKEMLALFAAKPYRPPLQDTAGETIDLAGHLTNTCFQEETTRESSVYGFWELDDEAASRNDWKCNVWEQICAVTGEIFEAAAREQMVHFQTLPNAFEIFGVDFLVDTELNVWLLELNAYPDFKQTGDGLRDVVVGGLFEEVIRVAVKPFLANPSSGYASDRMRLVKEIELGRD
jgi:tubulin---tyrosine ligase